MSPLSTDNTSIMISSRKRPHEQGDPNASESRRRDPKVSRACDACKVKKIRCSGTLPCDICSRRGLPCSYASKYARGRAPTPPFRDGNSLTASRHEGQHGGRRSSKSTAENASLRSGGALQHYSSPNREEPDRAESIALSRASPDLVIEGQYLDSTSGLSFLHRALAKLVREKQMSFYESSEGEKNQLLTSAGDIPFFNSEGQALTIFPDSDIARELLRLYFDTCVTTYRMLHRQTVEGWLETSLRDSEQSHIEPGVLENSKQSIILTILAIASFRKSKIKGSSRDHRESAGLHESDRFFSMATKLTDTELGFPRLESAQARLIQVLYLLQTSRMNKAWYTFGSAYQIISSLGLHRRRGLKSKSKLDYIALQCSRRVFWVAYTIDKYLSVVLGRPRLLHDDEINQVFPDSVNDEDMLLEDKSCSEPSEECHVDSLIFHAKIARIIGRISREVYSGSDEDKDERVTAVYRLVAELHDWHASLPPHLGTVKPSALIPSFRRQATALSLAYSHALIHVNRPFLLGDGVTCRRDARIQERVDECLSAAQNALELVNTMAKDNNLFHAFWWTHYVTFCALVVVYVWKIQQNLSDSFQSEGNSHTKLLELAETCHSHLFKASSAASPSRRYSIILEELRARAQDQGTRSKGSHLLTADFMDDSLLPQGAIEYTAPLESEFEHIPSMLEAWQTTDWLDLDSSVCFKN
ncbi:fungal-specific transcription factor domain-containing protein [Aspergillus ambiguus]|uniref:Zn(II)2Cys6 transcription factor n=1 Tax=Aspergillus ambiguus TaxID=176160 RepID=UPI003CCDC7E0